MSGPDFSKRLERLEALGEQAAQVAREVAEAVGRGRPAPATAVLVQYERDRASLATDLGLPSDATLDDIRDRLARDAHETKQLEILAELQVPQGLAPVVEPVRALARQVLAGHGTERDRSLLSWIVELQRSAAAGKPDQELTSELMARAGGLAAAVGLAASGQLALLRDADRRADDGSAVDQTDDALRASPASDSEPLVSPSEDEASERDNVRVAPAHERAADIASPPSTVKEREAGDEGSETARSAASELGPSDAPTVNGPQAPPDARPSTEAAAPIVGAASPQVEHLATAPATTGVGTESPVRTTPKGDATRNLAEVDGALVALLDAARDGLAYQLAVAADRPEPFRLALRALTVAEGIGSGSGSSAAACRTALEELGTSGGEFDRSSRLIAMAAAVRIACVAPHLGAAQIIEQHSVALASAPALAAFAEAIHDAATKGITVIEDVADSVSDISELETERNAVAERAAALIRHPPNIKYSRATDFIRSMVTSDSHDLGRMLVAVRDDDIQATDEVEEIVRKLAGRGALEQLVDEPMRAAKRPGQRKRIVGDARARLISAAQEIVELGEQWLALRRALSRPPRDAGWLHEPVETLRKSAIAARAEDAANLDADDDVAAAAARRVGRVMAWAVAVVLDRAPTVARDRDPQLLLAAELLRDPEIRMTSALGVREGNTVRRLLRLIDEPDWRQATLARATRGDGFLIQPLLALAADEGAAIENLEAEAKHLLEEARGRTEMLRERVLAEIAASFQKGAIDTDDWGVLSREATALASIDADETGDDFLGDQADDFQVLLAQVAEAAGKHVSHEAERLRLRMAELGGSDEAVGHLNAALARDDVATAERVVLAVTRGEPLLAESRDDRVLEWAFPAVSDRLRAEKLDGRALARHLVNERELLGIPSARRADDEIERVADGLRAADQLRAKGDPARNAVRQVLALIGLPTSRVSGGEQVALWGRYDVSARVSDKAIAPQFGSDAGGHYRVLVMRDEDATEDRITSWLTGQPSEEATIVLYGGVLSPLVRRRMADRARRASPAEQALVVDLATMASVAAVNPGSFECTARLTLPFTSINPYNPYASGLVPIEMFYGRRDAREDLLAPDGRIAFVYGGRRLGKSALLRAVLREAEAIKGLEARYIDLQDRGIGDYKSPDETLALIATEFDDLLPRSRKRLTEAWLPDRVKQHAETPGAPRLLVLLDEADPLIDADAAQDFRTLNTLRSLRDDTNGHIRFVFAGLHSVRRFHDIANQRLVQFGRPEKIGALEAGAARELLERPLEALGYRLDLDSVNRILTLTQYQPSLIQLICDELLGFLTSRARDPNSPPYQVSRNDLERVLALPSLTREITDRFELTVRLDERYRVIALVVAYLAAEDRLGALFEVDELRVAAEGWWPAAFAGESQDTAFDALLDEMVGLGILYERGGQFGLYSPHVGRMLGTQKQIERRLEEARRKPAPLVRFDGSNLRQTLSSRRSDEGYRLSPLNLRQVTDLQTSSRGLVMVVGSDALGSTDVRAALEERVGEPDDVEVFAAPHSLERDETGKWLIGRLKTTSRGVERRIAYAEVGVLPAPQLLAILSDAAERISKRAGSGASLAVFGLDHRSIPAWHELIAGGAERDLGITTIALGRHTIESLRVWASRQKVDLPALENTDTAQAILAATGGWPVLVNRVVVDLREHRDPERAIEQLTEHLSGEGGPAFVASTAARANDVLSSAFDFFLELDEGLDASEAVPMLAAFNETTEAVANASWRVLRALGVLDVDEQLGAVRPELVLAAIAKR